MKIRFLGTGAAGGIPSVFCNCRVCANARKVYGKEVRSRSGLIVNDDLLVDFSPDIFSQLVNNKIDILNVTNVLISHEHDDHLNLLDFTARNDYFKIKNPKNELVNTYSTKSVIEKLREVYIGNKLPMTFNEFIPYKIYNIGKYKVTPLKAYHIKDGESYVFLIEEGDKKYLHFYDSGVVLEETLLELKNKNVCVDVVSIDCTYTLFEHTFGGHLTLNQVVQIKEQFYKNHIVDEHTQFYLTHISDCALATHEELEIEAKKYGINVAYDGLVVEI